MAAQVPIPPADCSAGASWKVGLPLPLSRVTAEYCETAKAAAVAAGSAAAMEA